MIDAATLRARLNAHIAQAERFKISRHSAEPNGCEHELRTYKQTVLADNDRFTGSAYFVVRGCPKCKHKIVADYVIEK
jgi:hypothetical protein